MVRYPTMSNKTHGQNPLSFGNTIPGMFSRQVKATPHAIALEVNLRKYTYLELDQLSNQLAHQLKSHSLSDRPKIAIAAFRSAEMIIGILAILKIGGAYIPIDPNYPEERLSYLLTDSKAELLITHKKLIHQFKPIFKKKIVAIGKNKIFEQNPLYAVNIFPDASDLAYSIYTSGSTGKPKGVLIEHQSVINLVQGTQAVFQEKVDRFLFAYSFSFDGAVLLIWWTLLTGGTLVMAPDQLEKDVEQLANIIFKNKISQILTFPSLYQLLLEKVSADLLKGLKIVSVAGESCPGSLVKKHFEELPDTRFYNQYGPTEATVGVTIYEAQVNHNESKTPIGKSIDGIKIYILNDQLEKVDEGEIGEICIGGIGVARGYHKRPNLTADKFVLIEIDGAKDRIYRSGDLGKILPDGNIDFCGRKDTQVKLRGYRIELGEVEAVLKNLPEILEAVVLISEGTPATQKLIAYYQYKENAKAINLREKLLQQLPEYMVPNCWVRMDQFALTPAGKIDRLNLPDPPTERPALNNKYKAPTSKLEKYLVEKWEQSLGIQGIGIQDKFFEIGGNSLLAAGFISELQQLFNETIFIVTIFDNPTIEQYSVMLALEYPEAVQRHFGNSDDSTQTDPGISVLASNEIKAFIKYVPKRAALPGTTPQNDAAIFILAPPRSGTSLLRTMLGGHPKIFAANELQLLHFETMQQRAAAYDGKYSLWKEGLIRCLMELDQSFVEDAKSQIQQWENENLSTTAVFSNLQQKTKGTILLDKSPSYALDYNALIAAQQTFKNAKFIHLSRHPYAMINSFDRMHMDQVMYLEKQPYRGKQLGELIWHHSHKNILNFFDQLPANQHFSLTYESLVTQPEDQARSLCEFLNLDFHPDVITPYKDLEQKMTDGIYEDSKPMGDVNFLAHGKIKAELAEGWKKVKDIQLNVETKALANTLGYQFNIDENESVLKKDENNLSINENDIAIIGMHLNVPGANNIDEFWENLKNEKDVSRTFTEEEILAAGVNIEDLKSGNYVKRGMVLDHHDCFDEKFFGYTPKEAALMDPQHRIYLQVAYGALEDAGINPAKTEKRIGIYGSVARNTYLVNNVLTHPRYFESLDDFQIGIALEKDFPATKVAYKLNLKGPAVNFQTACSSSGVAIHMACQSLRNKDADIIVVGGGRIQPPVDAGYLHKDGHALSPTGYCHTFDEHAQGMVRGQGMAFIVLKKLDEAIKDGDQIRAVIKGSAINNDGADKIGFTAPSTTGQTAGIIQAYKNANVDPSDVSYIEAHGTGTSLGDPIEIAALVKAFSHWTDKKQYCAIASVKSNVGHLDAGACVLGVIKTALALEREWLPATMHFSNPNPQINFKASPFFVNNELKEWKRTDVPRYAGVSALGLGGTNAHIVLCESPVISKKSEKDSEAPMLFTLSAKTPDALSQKQIELKEFLTQNINLNLSDISYSLSKRQSFENKKTFIAKNSTSLIKQLADQLPVQSNTQTLDASSPVFLFPGGGAQHQNMGLDLYEKEIIFKNAVDQCLKIVEENHGHDFRQILYPADHRDRIAIQDPLAGITLLFIVEYATAKLWQSWGVKPKAMIGHSLGEYTAACLAGVFSLKDALKMVVTRGELFLELPEGGMLSIGLPPDEVKVLVGDRLDIAAINRPDHCVVSGAAEMIDEVKKELNELEIHATRPQINVAAHSREIDVILKRFKAVLSSITFAPANYKLISNLKGDWAGAEELSNIDYWLNHLRHTVRFSDGIEKLFDAESNILLEIGPGQTLATFSRQHKNKPGNQKIYASLPHPKEGTSDASFILKTLGELWKLGAYDNWHLFYQHKPKRILSLPTYPFAKNRHWLDAKPKTIITPVNEPKQIMSTSESSAEKFETQGLSRQDLILDRLKGLLHDMSGIPISDMSDQATFLEMGFDSLFLTQAVSRIKKTYKIKLSFRQLFDELTNLIALSSWLDKNIDPNLFQEELKSANRNISTKTDNGRLQNNTPTAGTNIYNFPAQLANLQGQVSGDVAKIIEQQLRLMEQQLFLLSGGQGLTTQTQNPQTNINELKDHNEAGLGKTRALKSDKIVPESSVVDSGAFREINKTSGHNTKRNLSSWDDLNERETKYLKELIDRYTKHTKGSQELTAGQRPHLADPRSISGFNKIWKDMIYQIAMVKSKGSKLWDVDGNEYIDFNSSFGVNLFGYSVPFIEKAVQEQLSKGFELAVLTPLARQVADLLCELSGAERMTLVNTGSEALSAAVRCVRTVSGRNKIAVFEGDYHGIADELLVRSVTRNGVSKAVPVAPGIPSSAVQNIIVLHYDDPNVLQIIEENADDLAGIIIEPIQPNNPCFQPRELIHQIRDLTEKLDIAMIFDEMITGFRIAPGGAQEWYDVEVDLMAYGKIISGGLPMAALAGKAKYLNAFDGGQWEFGDDSTPPADVTFFGGTFVKHPLSLAASLAALTAIKEGGEKMYAKLNARAEKFARDFAALVDRTKAPLQILSTASIICIKPVDDNPFVPLFFNYCALKGVHIKSKALLLTLAHSDEDLNKTLTVFEEVIGEMQTAGFFPITVQERVPDHKIISVPKQNKSRASAIEQEAITLPLTPGQKEVWIEQRLSDEAAAAYNLAGKIELKGSVDYKLLQDAVNYIVQRHAALRVRFDFETPTQTIAPKLDIPIAYMDFSDFTGEEQERKIEAVCQEESSLPFDLFKGPLIRFRLIKKSAAAFLLIMNTHHGVADGWSCGIVANELSQVYSALAKDKKPTLAPAKSYIEFIQEEAAFLSSEEYQENKQYWINIFKEKIPVLEFPQDAPRPVIKTYTAALEKIHLEEQLLQDLKAVAAKEGTTLFILLYNAFRIFISRLSGQDDFVLGLVAAAQTISGNENLVTHGVSLLPVRNTVDPGTTFSEDLKKTRDLVLDAFDHQRFTLGSLVQELNIKRDPSRQPIISFLFNMDAEGEALDFAGIPALVKPIQRKYETFDTFINVKSVGKGIDFEWIYNTDLFNEKTIRFRLKSFKELLFAIIENPQSPLNRMNLISAEEKSFIKLFESEKVNRDKRKTFLHYFSKTLLQKTSETALQIGGSVLSYQELEEYSNRLAHRLAENGVAKGDHIGIYFERSMEMIIALLATWKVGGVYVPIDPVNPQARCQLLLEDVQADYLLTHIALGNRQPEGIWRTIWLDGPKADWKEAPSDNISVELDGNDPAYVIYTSGSTGKPKSVRIPHHALIDHHLSMQEAIGISENDHVLSVASIAFDPSVQDYFLPLMIGAKVTIATREEQLDGRLLSSLINKYKITLMQATPATWRMLLLAGWQGSELLTILSGGEGLNRTFADTLLQKCQRLFNIYGPTETTIWSTVHQVIAVDRLPTVSGFEPVGKPITNVQLYLLDDELQEVPIGVTGELYVGGAGVAPSGYLNQPDLTAYHFVQNPLNDQEIIYRTGDLARYLLNGDLEFLGRKDGQVKIRGHRIEIGEIEAYLSKYDVIKENVVVAKKNPAGEKSLVAYVTLSNGKPLDINEAKKYLQRELPAYMIPQLFVTLPDFPLTNTLKVDRKKLPEPNWELSQRKTKEQVIPVSETEKILYEIWTSILNINSLSITEDFFELGGHSLIAVDMMARIEDKVGKRLPLSALLENPTIQQLATLIEGQKGMEYTRSMVPIRPKGTKPPIYLVHGAGLHVLMYQTLADHMCPEQPIFGFQARGLYGEAEPLDRIEDMAAAYIEEILERNPDGPYALAGYSFGGLITFEMAKQLKAMGKEVVMLGMFDTVVRPEITGDKWNYYKHLKRLGKKVAWNLGAIAKDPIHNFKYKSNTLSRRFKRFAWSMRNVGAEISDENDVNKNMQLLDQKNKIAFEHYRITPYDGKIHLFRAKVRRFWIEDFEFLGWKPFAKKGIVIHEVPGDHLNLFNLPNGRDFAKILQATLDELFQNARKLTDEE